MDVTDVPQSGESSVGKYYLEIAAGAGCRNKDYETCSKCGVDVLDQTSCNDETGCVWNNSGGGKCEAAEWCCMEEGLPDVWPNPQAGPDGRCGDDPKCYLFPEPLLEYYDNNVSTIHTERDMTLGNVACLSRS